MAGHLAGVASIGMGKSAGVAAVVKLARTRADWALNVECTGSANACRLRKTSAEPHTLSCKLG